MNGDKECKRAEGIRVGGIAMTQGTWGNEVLPAWVPLTFSVW